MYKFDVLELNNFEIVKTDVKSFYNTDDKVRLNDWARHKIKMSNLKDCPQMSSAFNVQPKGYSKMMEGGLGYIWSCKNIIKGNTQEVGIFSSGFSASNSNGYTIFPGNLFETVILFTARRLINNNWLNTVDEYIAPNEESELFNEFKNDSLIYSLFESKSNQSSLRQITYKENVVDIKNNFFWMSKNEMTELANQNNYTELYNDARTDSDRYVHTLLFGEEGIYNQLSDEAKDVLDSATNLVRLSFGMRRNFADDTNHLNSWDAGYAQLKLLWKEYYPEQFKEFRAKYKVLEDKMRPMVYELGFLLK
jgi:hypothetical protein